MNTQQASIKQIKDQLSAWYDNIDMDKEPTQWIETKFDNYWPVKSMYHFMVDNLSYSAKETKALRAYMKRTGEPMDLFAAHRDDSGSFEHNCLTQEHILSINHTNTLFIGYEHKDDGFIIVQLAYEDPKVYYGDILDLIEKAESAYMYCYCTDTYLDRNELYGTTDNKTDFEGSPKYWKVTGHNKVECTECGIRVMSP